MNSANALKTLILAGRLVYNDDGKSFSTSENIEERGSEEFRKRSWILRMDDEWRFPQVHIRILKQIKEGNSQMKIAVLVSNDFSFDQRVKEDLPSLKMLDTKFF